MGGCKPRQVWKEATVVALPRVPRITRSLAYLNRAHRERPAVRSAHVSGHRAKIPSAVVRRCAEPGAHQNHAAQRHRAEPHRPRLHFFRPARHRQDHHRAHRGALPELRKRSDRPALRRVRELPRNQRRAGRSTSSKSTRRRIAASTKCANCAKTSAISRRATATRFSSSTKRIRSPTKPSTRC